MSSGATAVGVGRPMAARWHEQVSELMMRPNQHRTSVAQGSKCPRSIPDDASLYVGQRSGLHGRSETDHFGVTMPEPHPDLILSGTCRSIANRDQSPNVKQ